MWVVMARAVITPTSPPLERTRRGSTLVECCPPEGQSQDHTMFETATLSYGPPSKRVWATAMGFTGQAVLIGCAVLAPLISPQTLGRALLVTTLVTPGAPPPPRPPAPRIVPRSPHAAATQTFKNIFTATVNIPRIATKI